MSADREDNFVLHLRTLCKSLSYDFPTLPMVLVACIDIQRLAADDTVSFVVHHAALIVIFVLALFPRIVLPL